MLPIKHRSIFKSRWIALVWAAGIVWTALDFAGGRPHGNAGGNDAGASNEEMAATQAAMNALDASGK